MNEPKRRGRPPKAAAIEQANCTECGEVGRHEDDCPVGMGVPAVDEFARRQAQSYANRIWAGQSVSLNRAERLRRVQSALEGQGMSMEGVKL